MDNQKSSGIKKAYFAGGCLWVCRISDLD